MKNKILLKKILIITCLVLGVGNYLQAQDMTFSQYFINKLTLNPAYAASETGARFYIHHREQYPHLANSFRFRQANVGLSLTFARKNFPISAGFGLLVNHQMQGEGNYATTSLGVIGSALYQAVKDNKNKNSFRPAFALGYRFNRNYTRLNWDKLVFSDQLDPITPGTPYQTMAQPPSQLNGEFVNDSYLDNYFGVLLILPFKYYRHSFGASLHHYPKDNISFSNFKYVAAPRLTLHWLGSFQIETRSQHTTLHKILPSAKLELQGNTPGQMRSLSLGLTGYRKKLGAGNKERNYTSLYVGGFYQHNFQSLKENPHPTINATNSMIGFVGFRTRRTKDETYQLTLSYDVNLSGLHYWQDTRGAVELSFVILWEDGLNFKGLLGRLFSGTKQGPTDCPEDL